MNAAKVLIVGAGLAGCTAARELADGGVLVCLIDIAEKVGGKVRGYGCKASDKCSKCGVCLTAGLWEAVEGHENVQFFPQTRLVDLAGDVAWVRDSDGVRTIDGLERVIVATGFRAVDGEIERLLRGRDGDGLLEFSKKPPRSVAFVQCYRSRSVREDAFHCSRVCCDYATRAAMVIKHFYPLCRVVFFYTDMRAADGFINGVRYVRRRVEPEDIRGLFDYVVLAEGIRADDGAGQLAEICGLEQDESGFLRNVYEPRVLLAGCVSGPKGIKETYNEAVGLAKEVLLSCQT